jgi:HK97 family phage prohead protease
MNTQSPVDDYEIRHAGFITSVGYHHVAKAADIARLPSYSRPDDGKLLHGYATRFRKLIHHDNKFKVLMSGCFAEYLRSGPKVRFLMNHDDNKCVGSTDRELELHVDEYGVAFRFQFPDTPLGREAKTLAETELLQGMSIGFDQMRVEYKVIEGETVCVLHDGVLHEISLLKTGAVGDAFATLVDRDNCGTTLRGDCLQLPMHLLRTGAFIKATRGLRAISDAL